MANPAREDRYLGILRTFLILVAQVAIVGAVLLLIAGAGVYATAFLDSQATLDFGAAQKQELVLAGDAAAYLRKSNVNPNAVLRDGTYKLRPLDTTLAARDSFLATLQRMASKVGKEYSDRDGMRTSFDDFVDKRLAQLSAIGTTGPAFTAPHSDARTFFEQLLIDYEADLESKLTPQFAGMSDSKSLPFLEGHISFLADTVDEHLTQAGEAFQKKKAAVVGKLAAATSLLYAAGVAFACFLWVMFIFVFVKIEIDLRDIRDKLPGQTGAVSDRRMFGTVA